MKLTPEQLKENGYELLAELDHMELIPFIREYARKPTRFFKLYRWLNVACFLLLGGLIAFAVYSDKLSFGDCILQVCSGIALTFLLIPLHEYLHALAYKKVGAKHTSYDVNWKKFYFMAVADRFVANRQEFTFVALAPITVISGLLIIALPFATLQWAIIIASLLLTHTAFCSGDFGLLSYFDFMKNTDLATYDDKDNKVSYFYGKPLK